MVEIAVVIAAALVALVIVSVVRSRFESVTVHAYESGLRFRSGKGPELLSPGRYRVYRPTTSIRVMDMRDQFASLPGQEVITSDSVSVKISLLARYRITDSRAALMGIDDFHGALYSYVQIGLREAVARRTIDDVLERRDEIGADAMQRCADTVKSVGLELISVDVRDLMFPGPLRKTFAQVIEARQQGLAALEKARSETAALRSLANAARMVEGNPSLLQLRLVQQLESSRGHTIVLGLPSTSTPLPVRADGAAADKLEAGERTPETTD